MTEMSFPALQELEEIPYLNEIGEIQKNFPDKIGVYAIFNQEKELQFIGYSRDIVLSLKQHFIRQPNQCYTLKVYTISRPSRTLLEEIKQAWITENGNIPLGNSTEETQWTQPISVKEMMTPEEENHYNNSDEIGQAKCLKQVCRRVEEAIKEQLKLRGLTEDLRFNPKFKEQGLLDLK